jgi:phage shock protein E
MQQIKDLVKNPLTTLVDVRSPMEFAQQHIPGAINIPLDTLLSRKNEIEAFSGPVILYCQSGNRSGMALTLLRQSSKVDVYNGGGIYDLHILLN